MAAITLAADRIAVSIAEASRMTSLSRGTLRAYARKGRIKVTKVGRRTIVPVSTLREIVYSGIDSGRETP
jgi:excisionase family DNA binding protein